MFPQNLKRRLQTLHKDIEGLEKEVDIAIKNQSAKNAFKKLPATKEMKSKSCNCEAKNIIIHTCECKDRKIGKNTTGMSTSNCKCFGQNTPGKSARNCYACQAEKKEREKHRCSCKCVSDRQECKQLEGKRLQRDTDHDLTWAEIFIRSNNASFISDSAKYGKTDRKSSNQAYRCTCLSKVLPTKLLNTSVQRIESNKNVERLSEKTKGNFGVKRPTPSSAGKKKESLRSSRNVATETYDSAQPFKDLASRKQRDEDQIRMCIDANSNAGLRYSAKFDQFEEPVKLTRDAPTNTERRSMKKTQTDTEAHSGLRNMNRAGLQSNTDIAQQLKKELEEKDRRIKLLEDELARRQREAEAAESQTRKDKEIEAIRADRDTVRKEAILNQMSLERLKVLLDGKDLQSSLLQSNFETIQKQQLKRFQKLRQKCTEAEIEKNLLQLQREAPNWSILSNALKNLPNETVPKEISTFTENPELGNLVVKIPNDAGSINVVQSSLSSPSKPLKHSSPHSKTSAQDIEQAFDNLSAIKNTDDVNENDYEPI